MYVRFKLAAFAAHVAKASAYSQVLANHWSHLQTGQALPLLVIIASYVLSGIAQVDFAEETSEATTRVFQERFIRVLRSVGHVAYATYAVNPLVYLPLLIANVLETYAAFFPQGKVAFVIVGPNTRKWFTLLILVAYFLSASGDLIGHAPVLAIVSIQSLSTFLVSKE
ncbi:hypothetical protein [Candidatus Thiodiazotropha sp. LNASS1]|uniref:hypothetical protein n=1 Tax=Candidatus Thiodiazotropha sp. LNASS1 TaxID=3096260 RepID=UPI0034DE22B5